MRDMDSGTTMIRIVVLSVLPGLVLIIQNSVRLKTSSQMLHEKIIMKDNVIFTLEVDKVIHQTQIERGLTSLYVTSGTHGTIDNLVHEAYQQTDEALDSLSRWFDTMDQSGFGSKTEYQQSLNVLRNQSQSLPMEEVVQSYSSFIQVFIDWLVGVFEHKVSGLWAELVAYHMLVNGKECVGIERSLGTAFFTTGRLSEETLLWYKGRHDLADSFLRQFCVYSDVAGAFRAKHIDARIEADVNAMRHMVLTNSSREFSVQGGLDWVNNMTEYINQLDNVIHSMAGYLSEKTEEEMQDYRVELVADIIIVLLTVIIVPLLAFLVSRIAQKMEEIRKSLQEKTVNLETEQKRTETLLSQLIPAKIAKRMHMSSVQPEYYQNVTVMFSDICNIDIYVRKSSPDELIGLLNDVFDVFDKRIAVHSVSKIGCLGNVLMVGSGLHQRHTSRHATHVANLALDLQERVKHVTGASVYAEKIQLKIGINSGPVISGVVEGTFPRFCMYGQTTTDAERMMVTCLPQHIQISESTQQSLQHHREFVVKQREDHTTQGTGERSYWLIENTSTAVHLDPGLLHVAEA